MGKLKLEILNCRFTFEFYIHLKVHSFVWACSFFLYLLMSFFGMYSSCFNNESIWGGSGCFHTTEGPPGTVLIDLRVAHVGQQTPSPPSHGRKRSSGGHSPKVLSNDRAWLWNQVGAPGCLHAVCPLPPQRLCALRRAREDPNQQHAAGMRLRRETWDRDKETSCTDWRVLVAMENTMHSSALDTIWGGRRNTSYFLYLKGIQKSLFIALFL